jgi:hypothetical protein
MLTILSASRLKILAEIWARAAIGYHAARTRRVSAAGLAPPQAKLSRKSNQVARGRIRRFESYMPSHAVRSPTLPFGAGAPCISLPLSFAWSAPKRYSSKFRPAGENYCSVASLPSIGEAYCTRRRRGGMGTQPAAAIWIFPPSYWSTYYCRACPKRKASANASDRRRFAIADEPAGGANQYAG